MDDGLRVVFFGTPEWAVPTLAALAGSRHRVAGVVTAPDRPRGRSRRPQPPPVKAYAVEHGIGPVLQPETLRGRANREPILALAPDALVVVAYGKILPGRLLDAPRLGAVNVHFSLLPRHRGASPVQHAILAGDRETGVTTMRMDRGLDTGPVLLAERVSIGPREDAARLGARLAELGADLLLRTLDGLAAGTIVPRPQPEEGVTWAPPITKEMGIVHWDEPAENIDRKVRAFVPWPPVTVRGPRGVIRLVEVEPLAGERTDAPPGTVLRKAGEAVDVAAGEGTILRVHRLQPAGSRAMPAAAAVAGRHLEIGGRLEDGGER